MKKLAVITATRAEFGLLSPVLSELRKKEDDGFSVELVVTGTHLYEAYGKTINEIEASGQRIDHIIEIPVASDSASDISGNQAQMLIRFTDLFSAEVYDAILILGDRYEMLAVAIAAGNTGTPVFHMCGGDTTEGAIDEWIRHSITKIAYLHFVTNEVSRRRVIQLGEAPDRVFNYGSTSIDNILKYANVSKIEALQKIGLNECDYALCTYHPCTMGDCEVTESVDAFLEAIKANPQITFIVTKANADQYGNRINALLEEAQEGIPNMRLFASLGVERYIALMRNCSFVLGNSSSGIIEAPACGVPTVNIGERQKGRLRAESVIDCGISADEIKSAILKASSMDFRKKCRDVKSPYGDGRSAIRIAEKCLSIIKEGKIDLKKTFFDNCEDI